MTFSRNSLFAAAIAVTVSLAAVSEVSACRGSRGGGGYSSSRSYSSYGSYNRTTYNYVSPSYHIPQPTQVIQPVQPLVQQPIQPAQQVVPQSQFVQQPGLQQTVAPQQTPVQPVAQQQTLQPVTQAPQSQPQMAPQQPVQPQAQAPAPVQNPAPGNAQMSALQALGGFAPPQAAPAQQPQIQTPAHVGTWTASLGNGASVQLVLNGNGTFSWSATNKGGTASSFSGNYTVGNGTLSLTRSGDNQQLGGSMTIDGNNAFSFKVAGNNAAAINFSRS